MHHRFWLLFSILICAKMDQMKCYLASALTTWLVDLCWTFHWSKITFITMTHVGMLATNRFVYIETEQGKCRVTGTRTGCCRTLGIWFLGFSSRISPLRPVRSWAPALLHAIHHIRCTFRIFLLRTHMGEIFDSINLDCPFHRAICFADSSKKVTHIVCWLMKLIK